MADKSSARNLCPPRSYWRSLPINRLKTSAVRSGCSWPYSLAVSPTRICASSSTATMDGVRFFLKRLGMITARPS